MRTSANGMVRVSFTGILTFAGLVLVASGLIAAMPVRTFEPVCRGSGDLERTCYNWMVQRVLQGGSPEVSSDTLMAWCGDDQLCRVNVLDGRPAGDAHAELAACRAWAPDYALTCEQGVRARHP
jgi:hypothetical protein